MKVVYEELFTRPRSPGIIVITTNSTIKRNGALVMGRGAAKQARDTITNIDWECGKAIQKAGPEYGFLVVRSPFRVDHIGFGIFQVKNHYASYASVELIKMSAEKLAAWANENTHVAIRMNFPGIGYGGLEERLVVPLLHVLPDNVTICRR